MVSHYKELIIWQKSMTLATMIYRVTQSFPASERYGLSNQMRRAAVSVPSNIAEGQARQTSTEFNQFLSIANGSLAELETQIILSQNLSYVTEVQSSELLSLLGEVVRMIRALKAKLPIKSSRPTTNYKSTTT